MTSRIPPAQVPHKITWTGTRQLIGAAEPGPHLPQTGKLPGAAECGESYG